MKAMSNAPVRHTAQQRWQSPVHRHLGIPVLRRWRTAAALLLAALLSGALAQATAGLPSVMSMHGRWSERALLGSSPELQEAYIAGALDAFMAVYAEGEAFAAEGHDPRNAYAALHEALAHVPPDLPIGALREALLQSLGAHASDRSAALALWRTLALSRCCWSR